MSEQIEQKGHKFIVFRIGSEEYALAIHHVRSVIRYEQATPVPRAPESILGVINLRGQIIPVVDLTKRFSRGELELGSAARIIVTEGEAGVVGFAVDAASEVAVISAEDIRPAPESALTSETADMFAGVVERDGRLLIVLDLDRAVPRAEWAQLTVDSDSKGGSDV